MPNVGSLSGFGRSKVEWGGEHGVAVKWAASDSCKRR